MSHSQLQPDVGNMAGPSGKAQPGLLAWAGDEDWTCPPVQSRGSPMGKATSVPALCQLCARAWGCSLPGLLLCLPGDPGEVTERGQHEAALPPLLQGTSSPFPGRALGLWAEGAELGPCSLPSGSRSSCPSSPAGISGCIYSMWEALSELTSSLPEVRTDTAPGGSSVWDIDFSPFRFPAQRKPGNLSQLRGFAQYRYCRKCSQKKHR